MLRGVLPLGGADNLKANEEERDLTQCDGKMLRMDPHIHQSRRKTKR
jgi:hypothetical protein